MNYINHKDNPKSFRSLTGMGHVQLFLLLPFFKAAHDDYLSEHEMTSKRHSQRRGFCIYKNGPLPDIDMPERLFFILVYLKNNPLQEYHAVCFGMEQKHCNTFVHSLTHILHLGLETMGLVSHIRVRVEYAIGNAKVMRIVKDECRLRANSFVERIFVTCAALHNPKIKSNPWVYKK